MEMNIIIGRLVGRPVKRTLTRSQMSPFPFCKLTTKYLGTVDFKSLFKMKVENETGND